MLLWQLQGNACPLHASAPASDFTFTKAFTFPEMQNLQHSPALTPCTSPDSQTFVLRSISCNKIISFCQTCPLPWHIHVLHERSAHLGTHKVGCAGRAKQRSQLPDPTGPTLTFPESFTPQYSPAAWLNCKCKCLCGNSPAAACRGEKTAKPKSPWNSEGAHTEGCPNATTLPGHTG